MNEDLEHKDLARRLLSMIEHALASGLSLPLYMVLVSVRGQVTALATIRGTLVRDRASACPVGTTVTSTPRVSVNTYRMTFLRCGTGCRSTCFFQTLRAKQHGRF